MTLLQIAQMIELAGTSPTEEQVARAALRATNRALWRATKNCVGAGCVALKPLKARPSSFQARDNVAVCPLFLALSDLAALSSLVPAA